jgi:hypothetical protein
MKTSRGKAPLRMTPAMSDENLTRESTAQDDVCGIVWDPQSFKNFTMSFYQSFIFYPVHGSLLTTY